MKENFSRDELLKFLIGDITSHGDSHFDEISYNNLDDAEYCLNWILERLTNNYKQRNSSWGSVADIGRKCKDILEETQYWLNEVIEKEEISDSPF